MSAALKTSGLTTMRARLDKAVGELETVRLWAMSRAMDSRLDAGLRMAYGHKSHRIREIQHRIRLTAAELEQ